MADLEELERHKRELELRRDIAKLERNERLANKASHIVETTSSVATEVSASAKKRVGGWGWFPVSVCTLIGGFLVLGGLHDGVFIIVGIGAVFLLPLFFKLSR